MGSRRDATSPSPLELFSLISAYRRNVKAKVKAEAKVKTKAEGSFR